MEWQKSEILEKGEAVKIPDKWLFLHYYEALTVLFRIENALRIFVYIVLKNEKGEDWFNLEITSDDASQTTIGALAKKRIAQDESFGYLGFQINSPLMYLTSGELVRLLTSDPYWSHFRPYFRASKQVVTLKLQEIGNIRNTLAHFRPLKEDDVEVVKQNAKQVLSKVESTIVGAVNCIERVPTNTKENWYEELKTLGTPNCQLNFNQSPEREWIRLKMQYNCAILSRWPAKPGNFVRYQCLNIDTAMVLRKCDSLRKNLSFLTEEVPLSFPEDLSAFSPHKDLNFTFSNKVLSQNYKDIKKDLEMLLGIISSETDLIKEDHLARGEIVRAQFINGQKGENVNYYTMDTGDLQCPVRAADPPEYWGQAKFWAKDFISDITEFPWMPVAIGSEWIPF